MRDAAVTLLIVGFSSLAVCWFLRLIERETEPGLTEDDVRLQQWPNGDVTVLSPNGHTKTPRKMERMP